MKNRIEIWMVSAEAAPLAHVGGLGDVMRALPAALRRRGFVVRRWIPAYASVPRDGFAPDPPDLQVPLGPAPDQVEVRFLSRPDDDGVVTTLIVCDQLFGREGIYGTIEGDYSDNARRFTLLARAVTERARAARRPPDVLHAHDWQAALVPLFVRHAGPFRRPPRTVVTIHNLGYQGCFAAGEMQWLGLEPALRERLFTPEGIEFHGGVSFLKAGVLYADRLTTVSPGYAAEIQTADQGHGLDGVLRLRSGDLAGILNGADYEVWDPAGDRHLPRTYDRNTLEGKESARLALCDRLGYRHDRAPILGLVGRLAGQKGIDILLAAGDRLVGDGARLAVLGSGEPELVERLRSLQARHPAQVAFREGFDEPLAHLIVAGSDLLPVPSRYEPCGLVQMHAMRYGTLPIVHRTGGLADTVRDERDHPGRGNGFVFDHLSTGTLTEAVGRATRTRTDDPALWHALQRRAMEEDFSWDRAAGRYSEIYRKLCAEIPVRQSPKGRPAVSDPEAGR